MQLSLRDAFALAARHDAANRLAEARSIYEQILAAIPEHPGALVRIAEQELAAGKVAAAHARLQRALAASRAQQLPAQEIWLACARMHLSCAAKADARDAIEHALDEAAPASVAVLTDLGYVALDASAPALAERCFLRAQQEAPRHHRAALGLALALSAQRNSDAARAAADDASEFAPNAADSFRVRSFVALQRGDSTQALETARRGLQHHPNDAYLLHMLGNALKAAGATGEAHQVLSRCLASEPHNAGILVSLGGVCLDLGRPAEALARLSLAIERGAATAEAWDNLGIAHERLGDLASALKAFETSVTLDPGLTPALANLVRALGDACDWDRSPRYESMLAATLDDPQSDARWPPHVALGLTLTAEQQLRVARRWSQRMLPPVVPARPPARSGRRVRVGYLSADFHSHATSDLLAGLFERHDRDRFEVFAYSCGRDDASPMRRRLLDAFEHWVDLRTVSDADAARRIGADEIDILVDLKGHTQGSRLGLLAQRPAPLQLHYLGFPGTLGFDGVGALVADDVVVPPGAEEFFHEPILRLPRCYQVNDDRRLLPDATPRAALGLPEEAIVLACFNQGYKLSRELFGAWMEALRHSQAAIVWLLAPHPQTRANLRAEAARAGVDPDRIEFASMVAKDAHIARLRSADLALDVLPYGSHTTGSDALWAGVPMLTCRGATFAGRVGASLLKAVDLPELIAETTQAYTRKLIALSADRERLAAYRRHLERERLRLPLFDTAGFTRDWEALLASAWNA